MKTFEEFLSEEDAKIPLEGKYGVRMILKRVKNQSDNTRKVKAANPTHKMPAGMSQHAAYSESEDLSEMVVRSSADGPGKGKPMGSLSTIDHLKGMSHHSHEARLLKTKTHPNMAAFHNDETRQDAVKYHERMFKAHSALSR